MRMIIPKAVSIFCVTTFVSNMDVSRYICGFMVPLFVNDFNAIMKPFLQINYEPLCDLAIMTYCAEVLWPTIKKLKFPEDVALSFGHPTRTHVLLRGKMVFVCFISIPTIWESNRQLLSELTKKSWFGLEMTMARNSDQHAILENRVFGHENISSYFIGRKDTSHKIFSITDFYDTIMRAVDIARDMQFD